MNPIHILAAGEGEGLPLEETPNVLTPALYDIVWSLIPFAVVLFVFWKFVLPMFKRVLDERTERIEGGIERAEAATVRGEGSPGQYNASSLKLASRRQDP